MNIKFFSLLSLLFLLNVSYSQDNVETNTTPSNKGKFYAYWGWNRASYSKTDITFSGPDHNFTLSNVSAHDNPQDKFGFKEHLNPARMTVPQTDFRIGYFLNNNYSISLGFDHMKYVFDSPQDVVINGSINDGSTFDGTYNNDIATIEEGFLEFEYTDGLNYINVELNRNDHIKFIKTNTEKIYFNTVAGIGTGIIFPRTNSTFLGRERYDKFAVSGFGVSAKIGLNITFLKHFFVQSELKGGYINMFDSKTTSDSANKAKHHFYFLQRNIVFGARFKLFNK